MIHFIPNTAMIDFTPANQQLQSGESCSYVGPSIGRKQTKVTLSRHADKENSYRVISLYNGKRRQKTLKLTSSRGAIEYALLLLHEIQKPGPSLEFPALSQVALFSGNEERA